MGGREIIKDQAKAGCAKLSFFVTERVVVFFLFGGLGNAGRRKRLKSHERRGEVDDNYLIRSNTGREGENGTTCVLTWGDRAVVNGPGLGGYEGAHEMGGDIPGQGGLWWMVMGYGRAGWG